MGLEIESAQDVVPESYVSIEVAVDVYLYIPTNTCVNTCERPKVVYISGREQKQRKSRASCDASLLAAMHKKFDVAFPGWGKRLEMDM